MFGATCGQNGYISTAVLEVPALDTESKVATWPFYIGGPLSADGIKSGYPAILEVPEAERQ